MELSHLRAVMNKYVRAVYKKTDCKDDKDNEDDELALAIANQDKRN